MRALLHDTREKSRLARFTVEGEAKVIPIEGHTKASLIEPLRGKA